MPSFDLSGRVAIVTGGNSGIGLGMAKGLAAAGARVAVAARDQAKNQAAVEELEALGVEALAVATDVAKEAACQAMVAATVARFGRLDILVNNAGTNIRKQPEEYTLQEWHQILETNLSSAFMASQAAYPALVGAGGGKMINIGSMMSIFGASFTAPYAATKGGIVQLTRALACAWAKDRIQVNAILPGWIDTAAHGQGPRADRRPGGARDRAHPGRPLGRPGRLRRDRGVPRQRRLGLRHRHGDSGRRRLLDPGLTGPSDPTHDLVGG